METMVEIPVRRTHHSRLHEIDFSDLKFGEHISDHMLVCDYDELDPVNPGWQQPHIVPFANLSVSPAALALHYGQTVFEGMKAFRMVDGRINIFRVDSHYERFARSLERMCMAVPPREVFVDGLLELVQTDRDWVPGKTGEALYLRPFIYASESRFGIKVSAQYRFLVFSGPVPELYAHPIKVKVETHYVRAARGGTGFAKCGGNYGAALYPTQLARKQGYDQILWTDAAEHKFIEESGAMNAIFVIDGKLVTPAVSDSILDGLTRDCLLTIARDKGFTVEERPVSIDELEQAFMDHRISEAFGVGTAAVVAPIQTIHINGLDMHLPAYDEKSIHQQLKKSLEDIRTGNAGDKYGWNTIV